MARITEIAQCIQEFFQRKSQCLQIIEKEKLDISFYNLAIFGANFWRENSDILEIDLFRCDIFW